jgi:N-acetyl sugar amidotransferase
MMYPPLWDDAIENRVRDAGENRDTQKTPKNIQFCKACVVSNQRPRITFDKHGVCSACQYARRKWDGSMNWTERRKELVELLNNHRTSSTYDVIVPSSGGKDSSFVACTLKDQHRMQPLAALFEPHIYTDIGRRNLDAFCHHGFDVVKAQPNGLLHRKLARLAMEFYGDPFMPFVYGQMAWPLHVAVNQGVGLVMYGENGEAEYGGDIKAADKPFWDYDDWDRVYNKGVSFNDLLETGKALGAISKDEARRASVFYRLPPRTLLEEHRTKVCWLGYYLPWHPMDNYYRACDHTGFEANDERSEGTYTKFASIDDKLDGLHYYFGYIKFGIGRCTSDAAQQVRAGDIDREEAVALVRRYDGEIPLRHLEKSCDYLGLPAEGRVGMTHLSSVINRFRPPHVWEDLGDDGWRLKGAVYQ